MGAESEGLNPGIDVSTGNVQTDLVGGYRYILSGDIKYPLPKIDPIDLNYAAQYPAKKWSGGIVNVAFDPSLSEGRREKVRAAFRLWAPAGITFQEGAAGDVAVFVDSENNQSYPGRVGGEQSVEIASWHDISVIAHEIGHLIGLEHEQQRSDRENHISVDASVLKDYLASQFKINPSAKLTTKYDLGSIMHYAQIFDKNQYKNGVAVPVFVVLDAREAPGHRIGYAPRPSAFDIAAVKQIYSAEIG